MDPTARVIQAGEIYELGRAVAPRSAPERKLANVSYPQHVRRQVLRGRFPADAQMR